MNDDFPSVEAVEAEYVALAELDCPSAEQQRRMTEIEDADPELAESWLASRGLA